MMSGRGRAGVARREHPKAGGNMMRRLKLDPAAVLVALLIVALGAWVIWEGSSHRMGRAANMGPGFYPVMLGVILLGLGLANLLEVVLKGERGLEFRFRPLVMISLSLASFAFLLRPYGLIPATFALVLIGSLAESPPKPLLALFTASALTLIGVVVFSWGLRLPLPLLRW